MTPSRHPTASPPEKPEKDVEPRPARLDNDARLA